MRKGVIGMKKASKKWSKHATLFLLSSSRITSARNRIISKLSWLTLDYSLISYYLFCSHGDLHPLKTVPLEGTDEGVGTFNQSYLIISTIMDFWTCRSLTPIVAIYINLNHIVKLWQVVKHCNKWKHSCPSLFGQLSSQNDLLLVSI